MQEEVVAYFKSLQDTICKGLEQADGSAKFTEDKWERDGSPGQIRPMADGGGGRTRVIQNGNVIEKGGVNFSAVYGKAPDFLSKEAGIEGSIPKTFFATGVSIVIHPHSPMVPIIHMNVRYLETTPLPALPQGERAKAELHAQSSPPLASAKRSGEARLGETCLPVRQVREGVAWFGGGIDLTPIYVVEEDAKYFHTELKKVCDKFSPNYYPDFKKWADDYFFIKHRNETRGVGGIFFDHLCPSPRLREALWRSEVEGDKGGGHSLKNIFSFVQALGNSFLPIYSHLIQKNKDKQFTEMEKQWQFLRRGRYAEFNLVYDRGTKFGLETNGRTESILMSLPPQANWAYDHTPEKNSAEEKTLSFLKKGIEWVK